jgi:carboxymethylenebutenolidase
MLLEALSPDFAAAQQVRGDDPRLHVERVLYASPAGSGTMRGYLARPAQPRGPRPGVLVIHENRGLNPHIEDIARRLGLAGFVALAPDALTPVGGYPGTEDQARTRFATLDQTKAVEDFVAGVAVLQKRPDCNGRVGAVGFCYGGGMASTLAVRVPTLAAAVSFYGRAPRDEDVPRIKAALLLHYAEKDERVNAGKAGYEAALKASRVRHEMFVYPGTLHGFNNDTTPRYDRKAAGLAWQRTLEFFQRHLGR